MRPARAGCGALMLLLAGCTAAPVPPPPAGLGTSEACAAYGGLPPAWGDSRHAGMAWIDGGRGSFGSERGYAEERPMTTARVSGFWIDRTEVTNAQFAAFVEATGHVSTAEKEGAAVFTPPSPQGAASRWWRLDAGANWRQPEGPGSSLEGRWNHPVALVSLADAQAYAAWLGRELPSEREWEFAAKAGRDNEAADAALHDAQGRPMANFWQGVFPFQDTAEDGHAGRAPVGCFPANPNGLHDMVGNVWEWTRDLHPHHDVDAQVQHVIKGGSYLCARNHCMRARASSRQGQEVGLPTSHVGFRTVLRD